MFFIHISCYVNSYTFGTILVKLLKCIIYVSGLKLLHSTVGTEAAKSDDCNRVLHVFMCVTVVSACGAVVCVSDIPGVN